MGVKGKTAAQLAEEARLRSQDEEAARKANPAGARSPPTVASIAGTSSEDVEKLMAEIADLKGKLQVSEEQRSEAEKAALAAAEAQGSLMQRDIQEVATGKMKEVARCDGYKVVGYKDDGREILKPMWKKVKLPTYFYKVDLPPCGGLDLKINGVPLYHGTVYTLDVDELRSVKEIVYRCWDHDRSIHGSDENFYRTPQNKVLSMRGAA